MNTAGDIQTIRLNRVEVRLADTDDPVAQRTRWDPAKPGGANFRTQKLTREDGALVVSSTLGHTLFGLVFAIPGALGLCLGSPWFFWQGEIATALFFIVWGTLFGGAGVLLLRSQKPFTIDPLRGVYYRGKLDFSAPARADRDRQGSTHDIHAIQLLSERCTSSSSNGGASSYNSYELNFVFEDGERINVMDHGSGEAIDEAAREIAAALAIPVWKAG